MSDLTDYTQEEFNERKKNKLKRAYNIKLDPDLIIEDDDENQAYIETLCYIYIRLREGNVNYEAFSTAQMCLRDLNMHMHSCKISELTNYQLKPMHLIRAFEEVIEIITKKINYRVY